MGPDGYIDSYFCLFSVFYGAYFNNARVFLYATVAKSVKKHIGLLTTSQQFIKTTA